MRAPAELKGRKKKCDDVGKKKKEFPVQRWRQSIQFSVAGTPTGCVKF